MTREITLASLANPDPTSYCRLPAILTGFWVDTGPDQQQNSTNRLQEALLDQAIEVIPDVIGMVGAAEMETKLEVGELGGIGKVHAGKVHAGKVRAGNE
jgi:hypothetical protein